MRTAGLDAGGGGSDTVGTRALLGSTAPSASMSHPGRQWWALAGALVAVVVVVTLALLGDGRQGAPARPDEDLGPLRSQEPSAGRTVEADRRPPSGSLDGALEGAPPTSVPPATSTRSTGNPVGASPGMLDHELLPGVPLDEFDPSKHSFEELIRVPRRLRELEREYADQLLEDEPSRQSRLVSEEDALALEEEGAVVLRVPGRAAQERRFLPCGPAEAAFVRELRRAALATLWADHFVEGLVRRHELERVSDEVAAVVPHDDGYGFDLTDASGSVVGGWRYRVPGTVK